MRWPCQSYSPQVLRKAAPNSSRDGRHPMAVNVVAAKPDGGSVSVTRPLHGQLAPLVKMAIREASDGFTIPGFGMLVKVERAARTGQETEGSLGIGDGRETGDWRLQTADPVPRAHLLLAEKGDPYFCMDVSNRFFRAG